MVNVDFVGELGDKFRYDQETRLIEGWAPVSYFKEKNIAEEEITVDIVLEDIQTLLSTEYRITILVSRFSTVKTLPQ